MKKRKSVLKSIVYALVFLIGVGSILIVIGIQHVEPASKIRQANYNLQSGNTMEALFGYAKGYGMALDAGTRSLMAKYFGIKMRQNLERNQLNEALQNCLTIVKILGKYDDEGAQGFLCLQIEDEIKR